MMTILGVMIFAGAFAAVAAVFAFTLVPALPRISALLRGESEATPTTRLVISDRHGRPRPRMAPLPSGKSWKARAAA